MNFYHIWRLNISVHSIIQKYDQDNKAYYFYRLYIKRNDGLDWYKNATFEEIEVFHTYLVKFIPEVMLIKYIDY